MDMPITISPSQTRLITQTETHNNRDEATSLSCLNFFKKIWKPLLGSLLLIVGIPLIFTGLVGGSVITLSGFAGFLPGFLIGPVAGFILVGLGGACVLAGLALLFGPGIMEYINRENSSEGDTEDLIVAHQTFREQIKDESPNQRIRRVKVIVSRANSYVARGGFGSSLLCCFGHD